MFGVPAVDLLLPVDDDVTVDLELPFDDFGQLTSQQVRELFTGHEERGVGGIGWGPAMDLLKGQADMPSADLHHSDESGD